MTRDPSARKFSLLDIATSVMTATIAALAIWVALQGPIGPIPMHFDINGDPDRWGDRAEMAWLLGFMAFIVAAVGGGMGHADHGRADPDRGRLDRHRELACLARRPRAPAVLMPPRPC